MEKAQVKVGVGVILLKEGKILVLKRKGNHAPYYSIPGGHLEIGESFEEAAIREVAEESSIQLKNPLVLGVTNNLETFQEEGVHTISIILLATDFQGTAQICEPDKCEGWYWVDPQDLPQPHFEASRKGVELYQKTTDISN